MLNWFINCIFFSFLRLRAFYKVFLCCCVVSAISFYWLVLSVVTLKLQLLRQSSPIQSKARTRARLAALHGYKLWGPQWKLKKILHCKKRWDRITLKMMPYSLLHHFLIHAELSKVRNLYWKTIKIKCVVSVNIDNFFFMICYY